MTTVQIQVLDGHPPPTGNPINIYAVEVLRSADLVRAQLYCSPKIWIPIGFTLVVTSALPGLYIISYEIWDGAIKMIAHLGIDWPGGEIKGLVAYGRIVEQPLAKIRFMHKDTQGRRIVTGDVRPIEDSDSIPDAESGE